MGFEPMYLRYERSEEPLLRNPRDSTGNRTPTLSGDNRVILPLIYRAELGGLLYLFISRLLLSDIPYYIVS